MILNRRATRVVLNSTEITDQLAPVNASEWTGQIKTTDAIYLGYFGKFSCRYLWMGTATSNTASVMSCKYWNGAAWTDVDDFNDGTASGGKTMKQSGFISWQNKSDWQKSAVAGVDSDVELYWIKLTVSTDTTANINMHGFVNIYSDDNLLKVYYPEFISNANYYPSGHNDYLDQHMAARDMVLLRMKQRRLIEDESQIIDCSALAVASVHACAFLILNPIATNEVNREMADRAKAEFENEIMMLQLDVDKNKDGIVSDSERLYLSSPKILRR